MNLKELRAYLDEVFDLAQSIQDRLERAYGWVDSAQLAASDSASVGGRGVQGTQQAGTPDEEVPPPSSDDASVYIERLENLADVVSLVLSQWGMPDQGNERYEALKRAYDELDSPDNESEGS